MIITTARAARQINVPISAATHRRKRERAKLRNGWGP